MSVESSIPPSDHRRLGQRLGLFKIDPKVGKGLPLWLPNGTVIRDELEKLASELEFQAGFQRVSTPHFASQPRSYRDLPLRLAECGQVYRWEPSGSLSGLARVRGMCMNDGHIYCMRDQVEEELSSVLDMYAAVYRLLGIDKFDFRLSRRDISNERHKFVDDTPSWQWAEKVLENILDARGIAYEDGTGHAAFYGPKIDIQVKTPGGTEETLSTVQLDFVQPRRLGLSYVAQDGEQQTPFCIHRAPFSTHERFVAFLTELYGGAFPTWLAPVQVLVISVSERFRGYATDIVSRLRGNYVRAEFAQSSEPVFRHSPIEGIRAFEYLRAGADSSHLSSGPGGAVINIDERLIRRLALDFQVRPFVFLRLKVNHQSIVTLALDRIRRGIGVRHVLS